MEYLKVDILSNLLNNPPTSPKQNTLTAILVADTKCELGECVIYNHIKDQVLWTDIYQNKLYKLTLSNGESSGMKLESYPVPKMLCAFALLSNTKEEGKYLCAFEDGFELYNVENPSENTTAKNSVGEAVAPLGLPTRLNDGRCDNEGRRFICGGFYGKREDATMKIFKCSGNGDGGLVHEQLVDLDHDPLGNAPNTVRCTNSLSFSPDGHTMYLADSGSFSIYRYKYNKETGNVSNKTLLIEYPRSEGFPDGSCVDSEGFVWNAVWREGKGTGYVNRIDPNTGEIVFVVKIPDTTSQITCCCFGGKDMDVLFISTAWDDQDRSVEKYAGGLYAVKVPFKGRYESFLQI